MVKGFLGRCYGDVTSESVAAQRIAREYAGLELETTYTAKAFAALLSEGRKGTLRDKIVLFWNTYNSRDMETVLHPLPDFRSLPRRFHSFFDA
jgi:D-cysteine desulfhydrase